MRAADRLAAFVLGTARNILRRWRRNSGRRPPEITLPRDLPASATLGLLESAEKQALLRVAIGRLGETDGAILELSLLGGLGPAEIAGALGLGSDVVRTRKSRAARRVAIYLKVRSGSPLPRGFAL